MDRGWERLVEWKQFGRPSGIYIDKKDTLYAANTQSDATTNPGYARGIRIGSAVMAVDIDTSHGFQAGTPHRLFTAPPPLIPVGWSLTPDAKRFLFITTRNGGKMAPFTVVVNWAAALKK